MSVYSSVECFGTDDVGHSVTDLVSNGVLSPKQQCAAAVLGGGQGVIDEDALVKTPAV